MSVTYIYCLADPRTGAIHYVGKTKLKPSRRATFHGPSQTQAKRAWLADLQNNGLLPVQAILEEVEGNDSREREGWWIEEMLRRNEPLTNYETARLKGLVEIRLYLTPKDIEVLRELGGDNASAGVRRLVEEHLGRSTA